jgi:hypothetical protein
MYKIAIGYLLLLVWCYTRAELARRKAQPAANTDAAPIAGDDRRLRIASHAILVGGMVLTIWGSGVNCLFWLPCGFIVAGLVQTLLPIRKEWR